MPYWAWSLLALAVFLPLFVRIATFSILRGLRFRAGSIAPIAPDQVPDWELELLRGAAGLLEGQGFRYLGMARQRSVLDAPRNTSALAVFAHSAKPMLAFAGQSDTPIPQCPFQITYLSCFMRGRLLATRNLNNRMEAHSLPFLVEQELFSDDFGEVLRAHEAAHDRMAAESPAESVPMEAACFLAEMAENRTLEGMRQKGLLETGPDGAYRFTLKGLWRASRSVMAARGPLTKARARWEKKSESFPLPPRAEAEAFLRLEAFKARPGTGTKLLLLAASLLVFVFLSGDGMAWATGLGLIAVLFVHETGHALAMRWAGYRDVKVFFIPFFGAIATGKAAKPQTPWREAFVLFAGPVPGLAAGAAALAAGAADRLGPFAGLPWLAVVVNAFNLLPIAPLDGGQLMQLIFFRRSPRLRRAFLVLSALGMAALAWVFRSPVTGVFSLLLLWGMFKSGKLDADEAALQAIGARHPPAGDGSPRPEFLAECFAYLRERRKGFTDKIIRIRGVLAGGAQAPEPAKPGWGTSAGVFAIYACVCAAPFLAVSFPILYSLLGPSSLVKRADLSGGEAAVYDQLCADSSVYRLMAFRLEDTLDITAMAIAPSDTPRLAGLAAGAGKDLPVRVRVVAPIWGFGGVDSTVLTEVPGSESGEGGPWEEDGFERIVSDTSALDSMRAAARARSARIDSLRRAEAAVWERWPAERRKAWLRDWRKKQEGSGAAMECFKG